MAVNLTAPESLAEVEGVELAAVAAELRYKGRDDLLLIELGAGTRTVAVFTQNKFAAAPVVLAKQHLSEAQPRALLINMGNANAATGEQGQANCLASCAHLGEQLNLPTNQIIPFSTGVIGEQFDMPVMQAGIHKVAKSSGSANWVQAAKAIMTTDTVAKGASREFQLGGAPVTITGIAKGAGMIAPNMATMLGFVATDAAISRPALASLLEQAVEQSFNRISIDSDTSTNDAVTLSATGAIAALVIDDPNSDLARQFYSQLESLMIELATSIVRDGEGATKFVKIEVVGGASAVDSKAVAESVANSPLVKTALFANDPNWGRFAMAIGKTKAKQLDQKAVSLTVNRLPIMRNGGPHPNYTEEAGQAVFADAELVITIELHQGDHRYHVWTTDFSHEYVSINADYRS